MPLKKGMRHALTSGAMATGLQIFCAEHEGEPGNYGSPGSKSNRWNQGKMQGVPENMKLVNLFLLYRHP